MLKQTSITVQTPGRKMIEITQKIVKIVDSFSIKQGLCHLFLAHTSASLLFCENYDLNVQLDLEKFITRLVPDGDPLFQHVAEGADDMPAHIRTILTQNSLMIPIAKDGLVLGSWQGIFLWEHRAAPHSRKLTVTIFGE